MYNSLKWRSGHGFGLVEVIVAVVVVALIGAGVYLYMQQQEGGAANLSPEMQEAKSACQEAIDDELLCLAFASWENAHDSGVTYEMTSATPDGVESTSTMKLKGDDSHIISSNDGQESEMMHVGQVTYMKTDDQWFRFPASASSDDDNDAWGWGDIFDSEELMEEAKADGFDYQRLGEESCQAGPCVKYQIVSSDDDSDSTTHLWVDKKSGKMVRILTTEANGSSSDMTIDHGSVTITAPADAKEFPGMPS